MVGVGPRQAAKRALVKLLLSIAAIYSVSLQSFNRDSPDKEVEKVFKRVLLRAHPDKGGNVEDTQKLNRAKENWDNLRNQSGSKNSSSPPEDHANSADPSSNPLVVPKKGKRIQSSAVLLTYNGVKEVDQWHRFVKFVESQKKAWGIRHWCATMEASKEGNLHFHLMLQFDSDTIDTYSKEFAFEGLYPNASTNDLLGEGFSRRFWQDSINRGFFYVFADKVGTQRDHAGDECVAGNYFPCWTSHRHTYLVKKPWVMKLYQGHKLTHDMSEDYVYKCRDGVVPALRNIDKCREREVSQASQAAIQARTKRIRSNPSIYRPFPPVQIAIDWLACFAEDRLRYPILIVLGTSLSGKTEWAKSLFKHPLEIKIGELDHFPKGMKSFRRGHHDGVVLDDLRDMSFLVCHQDKIQGKYDALVEFASSPCGESAYTLDLYAVPFAATANFSTANLQFLETNDFLNKPDNRVVVQWPLAAS